MFAAPPSQISRMLLLRRAGRGQLILGGLTIFFSRGLPRAGLIRVRGRPARGMARVKLDPEEQVVAAALDEAEPDDANECRARIEFKREGHAKVTITISRELVERARALN